MKKLRLLLWEDCNRNCKGCCNKQWDLRALPTIGMDEMGKYDQIILTGGEPLLKPKELMCVASHIKSRYLDIPLYVYTADVTKLLVLGSLLSFVDGLTVTLHQKFDEPIFFQFLVELRKCWRHGMFKDKSYRLNVFKGVKLTRMCLDGWEVKKDIEWIENCPLPEDEEFLRYDGEMI